MDMFTSDMLQFTKLLPVEIWAVILNMLDCPTDKRNCSNTSPFFHALLLEKRILFLFPEVLDILLGSQKLNSKKTISLSDTGLSEQIALQVDFERMKNDWEADQLADKLKNEIGCSYGKPNNKLDVHQGWLKMETAWKSIQDVWIVIQDTLKFIQRNKLEGTWNWERRISICKAKIHDSWKQMRIQWGIIGYKNILEESEFIEIRSSLRSIQKNVAQVKNIQEWALALPNLRLAHEDWSEEIGKRLTSDLSLLPNP